MNIQGKTAIITGAGGGIGRAIARKLSSLGVDLSLVDYNETLLEETAALVKQNGNKVYTFLADVSKADDVKRYVEGSKDKLGKIDFFHNNAGILQTPSLLHESSNDEFLRVVNINLAGVFYGLKYVLDVMVQQGSGSIVNTSSHAGIRAEPYLGIYGATKHAVSGLTKTAAAEYGAQGIRVNAICPGAVQTNMTAGMESEDPASYGPLQRAASPEEIAAVVTFLFSGESSYINGTLIPVDGGLSS